MDEGRNLHTYPAVANYGSYVAVTKSQVFARDGRKVVARDIKTGRQVSRWSFEALAVSLECNEIYYAPSANSLRVYCMAEPAL